MQNATEHETRARARKVVALVETLAQAGATAATVEHFTVDDWSTAAQIAGVRTPSEQTRAAVVQALELREQPDLDPFAGLDEVAASTISPPNPWTFGHPSGRSAGRPPGASSTSCLS